MNDCPLLQFGGSSPVVAIFKHSTIVVLPAPLCPTMRVRGRSNFNTSNLSGPNERIPQIPSRSSVVITKRLSSPTSLTHLSQPPHSPTWLTDLTHPPHCPTSLVHLTHPPHSPHPSHSPHYPDHAPQHLCRPHSTSLSFVSSISLTPSPFILPF
eukprot:GHVN01036016.1.p2 GENE.GHVN01036016.1~~GHVN01036016.1.p2  ORF type:complete len:154 (+),score=52.54 GHVN01036016.1:395-856(+)